MELVKVSLSLASRSVTHLKLLNLYSVRFDVLATTIGSQILCNTSSLSTIHQPAPSSLRTQLGLEKEVCL